MSELLDMSGNLESDLKNIEISKQLDATVTICEVGCFPL